MVVIRVKVEVGAENRMVFLENSNNEVPKARQFAGCLNYGWYQELGQEGSFLLYQEWDTQANFDAFRTSAFFKANGDRVFPLLLGKPETAYFDAQTLVTA